MSSISVVSDLPTSQFSNPDSLSVTSRLCCCNLSSSLFHNIFFNIEHSLREVISRCFYPLSTLLFLCFVWLFAHKVNIQTRTCHNNNRIRT